MAELVLRNLKKTYGKSVIAVENFSLDVRDGEFVVLVGPSGCGKSTTLRMIAGLEEADSGEIFLSGQSLSGVPVQERDMAMVFQNYALYPTMTVFENLAFPLKMQKLPKAAIAEKVKAAAKLLEIEGLLWRKPGQLSGGEKQRTAMGRALVREPKVFLMDEPLSNLDARLRLSLRGKISELHKKLGITTIYVTHDQVEAMTLADRIVVMRDGKIEQIGTPQEIYEKPVNALVASFFGNPPMNFFERDGALYGIRPEDVKLFGSQPIEARFVNGQSMDVQQGRMAAGSGKRISFPAEVIRTELIGAEKIFYLTAGGESLTAVCSADSGLEQACAEGKIFVQIEKKRIYRF